MSKVALNNITGGYAAVDLLNENFDAIEAAFDNTLSRDGAVPNPMLADFDLNHKDILNGGKINAQLLVLNGQPVTPGTLNYNGVVKETQTATASQTVFNLTTITYSPLVNNLSVYVDGVYQNPSRYTETSATRVTFSEGLHLGAVVDFVVLSLNELSGTTDAANVTYQPAGSGAVATLVSTKLQETVSVKDFGAVADGSVLNNTASGTDNYAAFTAALTYASTNKISKVIVPGGFYYLSAGIILPSNVTLEGYGTSSLPTVLGNVQVGTCLLINGATSGTCIAFESNERHSHLKDLSVFNTNTNAILAVVSIIGQLYPKMTNVEIGCLKKSSGVGLYIAPATSGGNYSTLWGAFENVIVTITEVGQPYEASVRWGLFIWGYTPTDVCNANSFVAGQFTGTWGALLVDGAVNNSGPLSCVFQNTKFDTVYDGTYSAQWVENSEGLFGWNIADCYIYPVVKILQGNGIAFDGCYFEVAGSPVNYNDGTHGSAPLLGAAIIDNSTNCRSISFTNCNWNGCFQYDKGVATLITPTTSQNRHDTRFATHLKESQATNQSIPDSTWTKVNLGSDVFGNDSELSWDSTNKTAIARSYGTYLITANVYVEGSAIAAGNIVATRIETSNGYTLSGNTVAAVGVGISIVSTVIGTVNLSANDTVYLEVRQTSGVSKNVIAGYTTFSMVKIG